MSARQPFLPQQRPPSRVTATKDGTGESKSPTDDSLKPNGLLPLTGGDSFRPPSRGVSNAQELSSVTNKPLNLAAFAKKKTHTVALPFGKPRRSFEDDQTCASSPEPPMLNQQMRLSGSSPFFASNPGFVPVTSRRTLLPSTLVHSSSSGDGLSTNQAHIPAKPPGLDGPPSNNRVLQSSQSMHSRTRSSSHPSLDKIHELAEEEEAAGSYTTRTVQDSIDGYHGSSSPIPGDRSQEAGVYDSSQIPVEENDRPVLRRVQKRFTRSEDFDEAGDLVNITKRRKTDNTDEQEDAAFYSADMRYQEVHEQHYEGAHVQIVAPSPVKHNPTIAYTQPSVQHTSTHQEHVLHRFLGQDLDSYVDAHIEIYEQAKKRWTECSMEEWRAGADELAERFSKLVDCVKDHMTAKLALFKDLHGEIQIRRDKLSERDEALKEARQALCRDGANVVSGGVASTITSGFKDDTA